MRDRIPRYPGRIKLTPVPNSQNLYDMTRADEPEQEGTPLNRFTLLSDLTVAEFGLGNDATPDDAMRFLNARRKTFESEQTERQETFESEQTERQETFEKTINDFLIEKTSSIPQIYYGSYEGTGEVGASYPNILTFDFEPKMLIMPYGENPGIWVKGGQLPPPTYWGGQRLTRNVTTLTDNGDGTYSLSWYGAAAGNQPSAGTQWNGIGTYNYIAIG